ncbi:gamma carbonic anhydrase family protein [Oceanibium sediminis]|uniref:gamma carbonic anhydrase family protein n=1 Tax=Oceanibium sediminis TaxID=2026339 RepID=UPI000DD49142|nr:phenylacetic acid degradation protein PaaY [Oceanibium sediminis]
MPCYSFEGRIPVVDPTAYVHPLAVVIGDTTVGPGAWIGPGASLRGDFGRITVGARVSVQDNCTMHGSAGYDSIAEAGATIGHGAILHGCRVGPNTLIGMNTVVLDGAEIGAECLVAAMSLVRGGQQIPPRRLLAGNPARVLRELSEDEIFWANGPDGEYARLAERCRASLVECTPLDAPEPGRRRNDGDAQPVSLRRAATNRKED